MEKKLNQEMLEALVEIQFQLDKLEFEEMLNFLVTKVVEVIKIERCSIFRIFSDIESAFLIAGEPKGKDEHGIGMEFSFSDLEALKEVVETKSYLLIQEPLQDNRTRKSWDLIYFKDIKAMLLVPLFARDEVVAIFVADATRQKKTFTEEEVHFCLILSNSASLLLERDLVHKEQEKKERFVTLGRVADEAAHRFRNGLTSIGGYARRLVKELKGSENEKYAKPIVDEVSKLEDFVGKLLCFTVPKKVNIQKINMNDFIDTLVRRTNQSLANKEVKINFLNNGEIPLLACDPEEIDTVFSSILTNAIEAIGDRKGEVKIRTRLENGHIRTSISNTGGCVDEEILSEIFNPFFTTKQGAAGLGLATASSIVNAYNGEIHVGSNEEFGTTTFIVRLPI